MNANQMVIAAKKDAKAGKGKYWGYCTHGNITAKFAPVLRNGTLDMINGRVTWTVDGKRSTFKAVQQLIG